VDVEGGVLREGRGQDALSRDELGPRIAGAADLRQYHARVRPQKHAPEVPGLVQSRLIIRVVLLMMMMVMLMMTLLLLR